MSGKQKIYIQLEEQKLNITISEVGGYKGWELLGSLIKLFLVSKFRSKILTIYLLSLVCLILYFLRQLMI